MSAGPTDPARRGKGRPASDTVRAGEQAPPSCEPGNAGLPGPKRPARGPGGAGDALSRAARSAGCSAQEPDAGLAGTGRVGCLLPWVRSRLPGVASVTEPWLIALVTVGLSA